MMYQSNLDWEDDFMLKNKYIRKSLFQGGRYKFVRLSLSLGG